MLDVESLTAIQTMATEWQARKALDKLLSYNPANPLTCVGTIAEISERWGLNHRTVMVAIETARLPARQSGSIWLIDMRAAEKRWGHGRASHINSRAA